MPGDGVDSRRLYQSEAHMHMPPHTYLKRMHRHACKLLIVSHSHTSNPVIK